MTKIKKEALIEAIAKKHHLILDDKDPIFAVVTANEIIFDELLMKANNLFTEQKSELENYKTTILKELKEIKIDHQQSLNTFMANNIQSPANNSTPVKEKEDDKDLLFKIDKTDAKKYWYYHFLPVVSSLLIGLSIGLVITYWF